MFPRWEGSTSRNRKTMASFKKKACPRIYNWKGQFFSISFFPNLCLAAVAFFCLFFYFAFLLLRFSAFLLVRFPAFSALCFSDLFLFHVFFTSLLFCQINTKPTLYIGPKFTLSIYVYNNQPFKNLRPNLDKPKSILN